MSGPVAILPAAGNATRLRGAFKELIPVVFEPVDDGLVPVPALARALRACAEAGIEDAVAVISPAKLELVRLLQDGAQLGGPGPGASVRVAWVIQPVPAGLTDAVCRALPWTRGRRAVVVLPDTLFTPDDALSRLLAIDADVTLAVFPTDRPHQLGPVLHAPDPSGADRVRAVLEKPTGPCPPNTWGLVAMGARFQEWLGARVAADPALGALSLGLHVDAAVKAGMDVRAVAFPTGSFRDLGTPRGLADWIASAD